MKKLSTVIAVVTVLCIAYSVPGAAAGKDEQVSPTMYAKAEANLLVALQSDNRGLSESAAYMLGELKSSKAIIPLMKMLGRVIGSRGGPLRPLHCARLVMREAYMR